MSASGWTEESGWFSPSTTPSGFLVAFSERGTAPDGTDSPTAFLARRFAATLGRPELPIMRAAQVHGNRAVTVRGAPAPGEVRDAGECDVLVTELVGVALVVQSADCVPILLAAPGAVGAAHAGWRGSALNAAGAAVEALAALGADPARLHAWLGPSIGACCYEVGGEVAARFAGGFVRGSRGGRHRLDLRAVNRAQLEAAGIPPENISVHPSCTRCGGEKLASYRRDGARSGRMIALVMRLRTEAED